VEKSKGLIFLYPEGYNIFDNYFFGSTQKFGEEDMGYKLSWFSQKIPDVCFYGFGP